ncbi:MAG: RIP metalloprotease RseP [Acetobacteraceae bacterium]|nr:RIP metalloprotease RseP [Acetobacteraceae bacterium]
MLDILPAFPRTVLAFVVVLGVLIFIHELGHYLAARWRGVHVERFSVGFGRALYSWTDRRGCEWRIGWIPLGGYVKMHGMEQPGEGGPSAGPLRPEGAFHAKPLKDRAIIVAAGPVANVLLAVVLFAALFMAVGRPVVTNAVVTVVPGSAAERAGILPGDRIVALDGAAITRFEEVQRHIRPRAGQPVLVGIERDGRPLELRAVPDSRDGVGVLGVGAGPAEFQRLDLFSALWAGGVQTADVSAQTLGALWQMLTGERGTEELGGPLRIAELSGQMADAGLRSLVTFIAVLSVNLALINLFPIPILDGGHLVMYAAEAVRGRPLPPKAVELGFRAGFALLIGLFVFATWNDLAHGAVGRWLASLAG